MLADPFAYCGVMKGNEVGNLSTEKFWSGVARYSADDVKIVESLQPRVVHHGSAVLISTKLQYRAEAVMIPLRNGFPLHANNRAASVFCLMGEDGSRVGHVVKVPDFGIRVYFEGLAEPGQYLVNNDSQVGHG